ncbi:hypothetical protein SAMN04489844_2394 [Nocardioides exalbidus]|uniref:Uncharacterized protein n=1 Tax=Nocardioides exalbidus TaxID=402596 RepID=A0A1H4SYK7_9ACTN|nr:hypothetical protein [Nocardioides exalbidus]SEC49120.1 hypothetical protein SAMN04489844_2394 [Nocardioides exalbidus]
MSERTSDLEARLRDALGEHAAAAPDATGLAAGARRRLRRRRTTLAVAVAGVVAAAVPWGLTALGDGGGSGTGDPDGTRVATQPPVAIPQGFRAETWHDLTFDVPDDWSHGGTDWCAFDGTLGDAPRVARPDTVAFRIGCSPTHGWGATIGVLDGEEPPYASGDVWQAWFEGEDPDYPDGTWMGYWQDGQDTVVVATPDEALTRRIVDSVRRFVGVDPHGCPATLGDAEALTSSDSPLTLCRYDAQDLLAASGTWTGGAAASRWTTLEQAPVATLDSGCANQSLSSRIVVLDADGYRGTGVVDGCRKGLGLYFDGSTRKLTPAAHQVLASIG